MVEELISDLEDLHKDMSAYLGCVGRQACLGSIGKLDYGLPEDEGYYLETKITSMGTLGTLPSAHQRIGAVRLRQEIVEKWDAWREKLAQTTPFLQEGTSVKVVFGLNKTNTPTYIIHFDDAILNGAPVTQRGLKKHLQVLLDVCKRGEEIVGAEQFGARRFWYHTALKKIICAPNVEVSVLKAAILNKPLDAMKSNFTLVFDRVFEVTNNQSGINQGIDWQRKMAK